MRLGSGHPIPSIHQPDHHCPPVPLVHTPWSSYWDSPEAMKLKIREGETMEHAIKEQISILTKANRSDTS